MAQRGLLKCDRATKETIDGIRQIQLRGKSAFMEQLAPTYLEKESFAPGVTTHRILGSLGIGIAAIADSPCVVATGNRFLLIHVHSSSILAALTPEMNEIALIGEALGIVGYYIFATDVAGFAATARMFAPHYGIDEEAATGMAAGPLACYLHDRTGLRQSSVVIQQGAYMSKPSPSRIVVDLDIVGGKIVSLFAGGDAQVVSSVEVS